MTWHRYELEGQRLGEIWKPHVVCAELAPALMRDLAERGAKLSTRLPSGAANPTPLTDWRIDLGGLAYANGPLEQFTWAELNLTVPSDHVARAYSASSAPRPVVGSLMGRSTTSSIIGTSVP